MSTPYIGEIRMFGFNFNPKGWALCNGQLLAIAQNQALFAILGTVYGGNGSTTFALPNLQGRTPMSVGSGTFSAALGQLGGESNHTLLTSEMPAHNHPMVGVTSPPAGQRPSLNNMPGAPTFNLYAAGNSPPAQMAANAISQLPGGQPHSNVQPYLVVNFCIALTGVFPSRN